MRSSLRPAVAVVASALLLAPLASHAQNAADGAWRSLFNGEDLTGWKQLNGDHVYEAQNGEIVGRTVPGEPNGFLVTEEEFGDFILELEVRVDVLMNNSGIQFRSLSLEEYQDGRVHGYQAEIDTKPQRWSGSIYDEARRGWLYITDINPAAKGAFVNNSWNRYKIEAIGTSNRVWVNGVPTAHLVDDETLRGFIGLQLHANNPDDPPGSYHIRFRNIRIQTKNLQPSRYDDIFVVNLIPNTVSDQERAQGFELLWDGESTAGWSGARGSADSEPGWAVEDGTLRASGTDGEDLVSDETFTSFELKADFRLLREDATCGIHYLDSVDAPDGGDGPGNGVMGRTNDAGVSDTAADVTGADDASAERSTYCLMASRKVIPGRWNQSVIRVRPDDMVEYWLNGTKILEYRRRIDAPKAGRIRLEHRGGDVSYRSIKIRELD